MPTFSQRIAKLKNDVEAITAARRKRKPKKPAKKGPPPKSVSKLAEMLLKKLGNTPYEYIEEMARDDGKFELKHHTFGEFIPYNKRREVEDLVLKQMAKWIENSTNRRALEPVQVDPDELYIEVDFDSGTISIRGDVWGTQINDPDQDIEVPASEEMSDSELSDALRALGAKKHNVSWTLERSRNWSDISDLEYKIWAEWEFDASLLALQQLDPSKVKAAVARGVAKHEP